MRQAEQTPEEPPEDRVTRGLHAHPGAHCVGCEARLTADEVSKQIPDCDEYCDACNDADDAADANADVEC